MIAQPWWPLMLYSTVTPTPTPSRQGQHGDDGPTLHPLAGDRAELLGRLEGAVDRMIELGGGGLRLEILLAQAGIC